MKNPHHAFTLIELLVVVAIIGVLAAIAVPNALNALSRAKISRSQSDMNALSKGLQTYFLDHAKFPPEDAPYQLFRIPSSMTTPVAYIGAIPSDPFASAEIANPDYPPEVWRRYLYQNFSQYYDTVLGCGVYTEDADYWRFGPWLVSSVGPDQSYSGVIEYNVSNGLSSRGDIFWSALSGAGPQRALPG